MSAHEAMENPQQVFSCDRHALEPVPVNRTQSAACGVPGLVGEVLLHGLFPTPRATVTSWPR